MSASLKSRSAPRLPLNRWEPPPRFVAHFNQCLSVPLRRLAWVHAICISHDAEDWCDGFNAIVRYADKHGARHLPQTDWYELGDSIAITMLEFIEHHEKHCQRPRHGCPVPYPGDVP